MIGSTFIFEPNRKKLAKLRGHVDRVGQFVHVDLDRMLSIDFAELMGPFNLRWSEAEPIIWDEDGGLVVVGVREEALRALLTVDPDSELELAGDLRKLSAFLTKHGTHHIFELSTF
jgi:hypothetical protein